MTMPNARNRICDATRSIIANDGVAGLSMRRIAAEVGVSATAIYRHFEDKNALVRAVVDEGFSLLEQRLRRACKGQAGTRSILAILDGYVDFALAHPNYYDVMFLVPRQDVRRYPDDFQRRESTSFNLLRDLVSEAIAGGDFKSDDSLETALTLWSHVHGFVSLYRCGRFGDHPVRFRKACRRSVQRLIDGLAS